MLNLRCKLYVFPGFSRFSMILIATLACLLPISFIVWVFTLVSSWLHPDSDFETVSPLRCALSVFIPLVIAFWGLKKKSLDTSGAIAGIVVGFILTISNYAFLASLFAFFISSSKATKFKSKQKQNLEGDFKEGGQRNWIQVLSNGGVGAQMAILYMLEKGLTECTINFQNDYAASWFSIAVLASLAGANGDTWASEIASVLTKEDPVLITSMKRVPKGTNGGISLLGLFVSLLGGTLVGLMYYVALILCINEDALKYSPPQWPLIFIGSFAGLFDSVLDSLLGATLQFSGIDKKGKIVEQPGPGVKHVSGVAFLDNHSVNLLSTLASAILVPYVAICIWNQF